MPPLSENDDIRMYFEDKSEDEIRENKRISKTVMNVLDNAVSEQRITCGLIPAVKQMELDPGRIAFCLLSQNNGSKDTAASHIHKVLLQAFCYENNITIIQVDCLDVLKRKIKAADCSCVVVLQPWNNNLDSPEKELKTLCNFTSYQTRQPIIKLPMK